MARKSWFIRAIVVGLVVEALLVIGLIASSSAPSAVSVPTLASLPTSIANADVLDAVSPSAFSQVAVREDNVPSAPEPVAQEAPPPAAPSPSSTDSPPTAVPTLPPFPSPTPLSQVQTVLPPPIELPQEPLPNQVVITFAPGASSQAREAYIAQLGGEVKQSIGLSSQIDAGMSTRQEITLSLDDSDGSVHGVSRDEAQIIYVNGICTSVETHVASLTQIDSLFGLPVMGIYNRTQPTCYIQDTWEAFWMLLEPALNLDLSNPSVQSLMSEIQYHFVNNISPNLKIVAHSQGALITSLALRELETTDAGNFSTYSNRIEVITLGGAANNFPDGPTYKHYINGASLFAPLDLVRVDPVTRAGVFGPFSSVPFAEMFFNLLSDAQIDSCPSDLGKSFLHSLCLYLDALAISGIYSDWGQVGGVVTNHLGEPLSGVTVNASSGGSTAITNTNGIYSLWGVPSGNTVITATNSNYGSNSVSLNVVAQSSQQAPNIVITTTAPPQDNELPTASWLSPLNGATFSTSTITLSANASDNPDGSGVREVRFSAKWNDQWYGIDADTTDPYSIIWDWCAAGVPDGDVELGLEVWDNASNKWVYSEHFTNIHVIKSGNCSSGGSCPISVDQIALFEHSNYSGLCVALDAGEYSNADSIEIANDSVSSIRVGSNVQAILCQQEELGESCEMFTADDADLTDNLVGDDTVSSVVVQASRPATLPIELAPVLAEPSDPNTSISNPITFFTRFVHLQYSGGTLYLSSQPDIAADISFDDALRITVTHADDSQVVFYHEFRTSSNPTFDFSPWLEPGNNLIRVDLIDLIRGSRGGAALYLTSLEDVPFSLPPNLARGGGATASSTEWIGVPARLAIDGDLQTRWASSQRQDPQWITIDLWQPVAIQQIVLVWEAAYAESYRIDFSNDGVNWTTAAYLEAMNGGINIIPVSGSARYVRMYGLTRGQSGFGYSLYEFAIYDYPVFQAPEPQVRPPTPVPGTDTLFFDDLEDGADPAWTLTGDVTVADGLMELVVPCGTGVVSSAFVGDTSWIDYEVQFDFRGVAGSGKQFQFRRADSTSAGSYTWFARSLENDLGLTNGGFPETRTSIIIDQGVWYRVRIRAQGEHIQIYVDDQLIVDRIDIGTQRLSGAIGPYLQSGTANCPNRVQYDNVMVNQLSSQSPDTTPPIITLLGDNPLELTAGDTYTDPGFSATDDVDGDITANVVITGSVDTNTVGSYTLNYNVSDAAGNAAAPVTRTVNVNAAPDTTPPVITLLGANPLELTVGDTFTDPGATALDDVDGDITANIVVTGTVDTNTVGSYTLTYNVSDAAGNAATPVTRTVNVNVNAAPDTTAPVITLLGANPLNLTVGDSFTEPGFTATDDVDGDITGNVVVTGTVDTNTVGSYTLTYNVSDAAGNAATPVMRTVNVNAAPDTTPPVIMLLGDNPLNLAVGDSFTDPGATALDDVDGDISANIVVTGSVDTNTVGSYTLTYNVSDAAGNAATPVTRTVNVSSLPVEVVTTKLMASDNNPADFFSFGNVVDMDGDVIVVGGNQADTLGVNSNTGAAYVFRRVSGVWRQEAKLIPDDLQAGDTYGWAVAVDQNVVMVGTGGFTSGDYVYVFEYDGVEWAQVAKLPVPDTGTDFGVFAVDIDGSTAVAGVYGKVYVFDRSGGTWVQQTVLEVPGDFTFGSDVALEGSTLLVSGMSIVHVFENSGGTWSPQTPLTPGSAACDFSGTGDSIDLAGGVAIIASDESCIIGGDDDGINVQAFVFTFENGTWSQTGLLIPEDRATFSFYPIVATDGSNIAILNRDVGTAAAYQFSLDGSNWVQEKKLLPDSTQTFTSAALRGNLLLMGAPYENAVYITDLTGAPIQIGPPLDNQPPTGSIFSPTNGIAVNWPTLGIAADATDDISGVNRVEFWANYETGGVTDWRLLGTANASPYVYVWDWSLLADQSIELRIDVYDNAGNSTSAAGGIVQVTLDRGSPTAAITNHTAGEYINTNAITIDVDASDSLSGVQSVQFFVGYNDAGGTGLSAQSTPPPPPPSADGEAAVQDVAAQDYWKEVGTDTDGSDGWSINWDASVAPDTLDLSFFVYAYDRAGNYQSAAVYATILDRTPPTSAVQPLAAESPYVVDLLWQGTDNISGIANYDLQASDNGGTWTDYLVETPFGGIGLILTPGHTYAFRSRARDLAGNVEDWPALADTSTTIVAPPANDQVSGAIVVASLPYTNSQDVFPATYLYDPEPCPGDFAYNTVWYQYTSVTAQVITVDTVGSEFDTVLGIFTDPPGDTTRVACDHDSGGNLTSRVTFNAVAGTTYYIAAGKATYPRLASSAQLVLNVTAESVDTIPPIITLLGDNPVELTVGTAYVEPGYTASDDVDGDITGTVVVTGTVDTNTIGSYTLTYNVSDAAGNAATPVTRTVNVVAATASVDVTFTIAGGHATHTLPLEITLVDPATSAVVLQQSLTSSGDASSGHFSLSGITPGTYDLYVKGANTLREVQSVTLAAGSNAVNFTALRSGDANGDNVVSLADFSILALSFNKMSGTPGYDGRADFNGDNVVSLADFSKLALNFNTVGVTLPTP